MKFITVPLSNSKKATKDEQGFTLIELLVVIGILAILMGIVLIAINPARQFAQANNTTRSNAVNQILNALGAYLADNKGVLPAGIPTSPSAAAPIASGAGNVDLCTVLVPTYISAIPNDPNNNAADITVCTSYNSGYTIVKDTNGRVTIAAPNTQIPPAAAAISVTR